MPDKQVRLSDEEAAKMLVAIAKHDRRTQGNVVALLVRAQYARLFSQPRTDVLVSEAMAVTELESVGG